MSTLYVNNIEPVSGSSLTLISASLLSVDSITAPSFTSSFQGDLQGTASFAITASHALNSTPPAGTIGQVQFSSGSEFGADSNLFWDNTNKYLGVGTDAPTRTLDLNGTFQMLGGSGTYPFDVMPNGGFRLLSPSGNVRALNFFLLLQGTNGIQLFSSTIIGSISTPSARLQVVGSGTTSATTALLVQNSNASSSLAVLDDGAVGIGLANPSASLHIKGSGSTSATTSLLVQNSIDTNLLQIRDNGLRTIQINPDGTQFIRSGGSRLEFRSIISSGIDLSSWSALFSIQGANTNNLNIGSTTDLGAKLGIKGKGSTSATTALLVQNSNSSNLIEIKDSGECNIGGNTTITRANINLSGGFLGSLNFTTINFANWNGTVFGKMEGINPQSAYFVFGGTSINASAKVQFDSTTQGFLPPRMTTTEKNAISSPAAGLQVYDTTVNKMAVYNSSSWENTITEVSGSPNQVNNVWSGTQAQYDALTPSSTTLYFIV